MQEPRVYRGDRQANPEYNAQYEAGYPVPCRTFDEGVLISSVCASDQGRLVGLGKYSVPSRWHEKQAKAQRHDRWPWAVPSPPELGFGVFPLSFV